MHVENHVDAILAELGNQVVQPVEALGTIIERRLARAIVEILQPVHSRDVDALAAHPADGVINLLLGEAAHLGSPETRGRAVLKDEPVALHGYKAVLACRRLDPPATVQNGRPEVVLHRFQREPIRIGCRPFAPERGATE